MQLNEWLNWCLSVVLTGVNWLRTCTLLGVPILYLLIAIFVMGVVIRAIIYRA